MVDLETTSLMNLVCATGSTGINKNKKVCPPLTLVIPQADLLKRKTFSTCFFYLNFPFFFRYFRKQHMSLLLGLLG